MKTINRYLTCDNVEHKTHDAAESHCLDKATLTLAACLRDAGIENPHAYATKIIASAVAPSDDLGKAYYQLFEVVMWIKDSYEVENV